MRPKLFILFLFINSFSFAQQPLTTEQINRLADAGKVYGYIKYFHPWLQYKDINWDSTFAANVEGIIKTTNREDYVLIMQKLFSSLNDGLTTVVNFNGSGKDYNAQQLIRYVKDSIMYILMNDLPLSSTAMFKRISFRLYNNWGELIYVNENQESGWDGTYKGQPVPLGVYVWILDADLYDNTSVRKTGDVTVLK